MSAKSKKSAKVSQEELRKLMKQKTQTKRIDSPYAKYNSLDQLTCSACAKMIKSTHLWQAHVLSKPHKEMVDKMQMPGPVYKPLPKKAKLDTSTTPLTTEPKVIKSILKNSKNTMPSTLSDPTTPTTNNSDVNNTDDKSNEIDIRNNRIDKDNENNSNNNNHDIHGKRLKKTEDEEEESLQGVESNRAVSTSAIPEGFFDDPKLDAKARNIKYVDKMEEALELFQKEIKQTEQENQVLVEEEDELTSEERSLSQLDEELNLWSKPFSLAKRKDEKLQLVVTKVDVKEEKDSDDENVDLSSLLDWRSKVPFKN